MCRGDPGSGLRAVEARPHAGVLPPCEVVHRLHPCQHDAERATAVAAAVEVVAAAAAARGAAEHCRAVVPREQTGVRQRLVVAGDGVPHDEVDPPGEEAEEDAAVAAVEDIPADAVERTPVKRGGG